MVASAEEQERERRGRERKPAKGRQGQLRPGGLAARRCYLRKVSS